MRRRGGKKGGAREDDETVSTGCELCVASRMLLLHMQEIVFVDSQEGLLSSRGGGGRHTGTRLTTLYIYIYLFVFIVCRAIMSKHLNVIFATFFVYGHWVDFLLLCDNVV